MQDVGITVQQRAIGAYLGLAIGDALGATTEFLAPREIREEYGVHRRICGGGWLGLKPGQVTDDTEMALALGRSILRSQGVDAESVAEAFSDWMHNKPVDIGNTVRRGIMHYRITGRPYVAENKHNAGNGACMRCLPVALACLDSTGAELAAASRAQAHVTHNNAVADAGTETVLQMLVSAMKGMSKRTLQDHANALVESHSAFRYNGRRVEKPGGWIVETLQAVFQAFFEHQSLEEILIDVVNRGGDADTTGAIAGMLAGAYYGSRAIPAQWLRVLNADVRRSCEKQALDLLALAVRKSAAGVHCGALAVSS